MTLQESMVNTQNKNGLQDKDQTEQAPKIEHKADLSRNQKFSINNELKPRIQTILHQLNNQQTQHSDKQSSAEFQQDTPLSNIAVDANENTPTASSSEALPSLLKQVLSVEHFEHKSNENQPEQQKAQQTGLLQTPNWLAEIQATLNNRRQELNTQAKPEPVINVTIGRVEVRAVQTDSPKQPEAQNKPKGIMSLGDYLAQRNKGRS